MTEGALGPAQRRARQRRLRRHTDRASPTSTGLACYNVYRTKDDRYLAVGALEPKFWLALNEAVAGRPPSPSSSRGAGPGQGARRARRDLRDPTAAEWNARSATTTAASRSSRARRAGRSPTPSGARGVFTFDAGPGIGLRPPARTPLGTPSSPRPPPTQGQHTRDVLARVRLLRHRDHRPALRGRVPFVTIPGAGRTPQVSVAAGVVRDGVSFVPFAGHGRLRSRARESGACAARTRSRSRPRRIMVSANTRRAPGKQRQQQRRRACAPSRHGRTTLCRTRGSAWARTWYITPSTVASVVSVAAAAPWASDAGNVAESPCHRRDDR